MLIEMRKHQRGISKRITQIEGELEEEFNKQQVDQIEFDMGYLSRKQKDDRTSWVIEI